MRGTGQEKGFERFFALQAQDLKVAMVHAAVCAVGVGTDDK